MISRDIENKTIELSKKFPVIGIMGPRQSGKTTLVKKLFPEKPYINLEDLTFRNIALDDPKTFIRNYPEGAVFDEIQRVPELFSYIQLDVDNCNTSGKFILTGSNNFLLNEKITQTLAGRIAILRLLPFSINELKNANILEKEYENLLFRGFYPRIYDKNIDPQDWYPNYIETYIERDVRQIKNIANLDLFRNFVELCAARIGQIVNYSSIGNDCGASHHTIRSWISILKQSYIVFELPAYNKNYNKILTKMPKIYFCDPGLAVYMLRIKNGDQLKNHYLKGGIFENMVILEVMKYFHNNGQRPNCYFWREKNGKEIDLIVDTDNGTKIFEIKSSRTINSDYFKNLKYFQKLSNITSENSGLFYGDDNKLITKNATIIPWNSIFDYL